MGESSVETNRAQRRERRRSATRRSAPGWARRLALGTLEDRVMFSSGLLGAVDSITRLPVNDAPETRRDKSRLPVKKMGPKCAIVSGRRAAPSGMAVLAAAPRGRRRVGRMGWAVAWVCAGWGWFRHNAFLSMMSRLASDRMPPRGQGMRSGARLGVLGLGSPHHGWACGHNPGGQRIPWRQIAARGATHIASRWFGRGLRIWPVPTGRSCNTFLNKRLRDAA